MLEMVKKISEARGLSLSSTIRDFVSEGIFQFNRKNLDVLKVQFNEKTIKKLVEKRAKAELELSSCIELIDGSFDLLNSLQGKIKLALATMNNKQVIEQMLNNCGLISLFDVVLSANEVEKTKPNPEIFLKCASKLALKPSSIVVIEDSKFGVRAAKAAKMKCIAVLSGVSKKKELELENPDLIVGSIKEKEEILKFILS